MDKQKLDNRKIIEIIEIDSYESYVTEMYGFQYIYCIKKNGKYLIKENCKEYLQKRITKDNFKNGLYNEDSDLIIFTYGQDGKINTYLIVFM